MLINEVSNLNLDDGSIDMKFDVETCRPLIPSTDWRNSNDDQHISKGSIFNEEQHESLLQTLVSYENLELRDILSNHIIILESHFDLLDTFKREINGTSRWKLRNIYSSSKPIVKMKPNKLLTSLIIISIHARRGRVVKLKSARYQLVDEILMKRNFDSHL